MTPHPFQGPARSCWALFLITAWVLSPSSAGAQEEATKERYYPSGSCLMDVAPATDIQGEEHLSWRLGLCQQTTVDRIALSTDLDDTSEGTLLKAENIFSVSKRAQYFDVSASLPMAGQTLLKSDNPDVEVDRFVVGHLHLFARARLPQLSFKNFKVGLLAEIHVPTQGLGELQNSTGGMRLDATVPLNHSTRVNANLGLMKAQEDLDSAKNMASLHFSAATKLGNNSSNEVICSISKRTALDSATEKSSIPTDLTVALRLNPAYGRHLTIGVGSDIDRQGGRIFVGFEWAHPYERSATTTSNPQHRKE